MKNLDNKPQNRRGGYNQHTRYGVFAIVLACIAILSFCISYAFFATSKEVDGVSFSFKKLDINLVVNGASSTNEKQITINGVNTGSNLFNSVAINMPSDSQNGYVRVRVNYIGTTNDDAKRTAIALNSILPQETTFSSSDYAWTYSNGYFYLTNRDKNALKAMSANNTFNLFASGIKMPDLTQFGDTLGLSTTGVSLQIKAEAVQSTNLQYTDNGTTKNVTSVSDLEKTITSSKIFSPYTEAGHIVRYDTCGGVSVDSAIAVGASGSTTLPYVGGVSVTWCTDKALSKSIGASGAPYSITSNVTLYAKYSDNNNTIKVFFNVNGGDENNTPTTQDVTKGSGTTTAITVNKTPTRQGYKLSGWKVGKDGTTHSVSGGKITVNNSEITTNAITLYAVWTVEQYTATFNANGGTISGNSSLKYTINDRITFPTVSKTNSTTVGWKVTSAGGLWRKNDLYTTGQITSGYYGNVTFTAQFAKSISNATISAIVDQTHTGESIEPKPTVKDGSTTLTENTHYTISYSNNVKVGTATLIITGIGDYTGSKTATFEIIKTFQFPVINTTSLFYLNGSLYEKSNSKYYKCSYCNEYSTSSHNDKGCLSSSHEIEYYYYCESLCGYTTEPYHTEHSTCGTCEGKGYIAVQCSTCGGTGYGQHRWEKNNGRQCNNCSAIITWDNKDSYTCPKTECSDCAGSGNAYYCTDCSGKAMTKCNYEYSDGDYNEYQCENGIIIKYEFGSSASGSTGEKCPNCKGTGYIACQTCKGTGTRSCFKCGGDGLVDEEIYHDEAYHCSECGLFTMDSDETTGCYHNRLTNVYYLYAHKKGTNGGDFYSQNTFETGYYWHDTYGALKFGSIFTYDGIIYKVDSISGVIFTVKSIGIATAT